MINLYVGILMIFWHTYAGWYVRRYLDVSRKILEMVMRGERRVWFRFVSLLFVVMRVRQRDISALGLSSASPSASPASILRGILSRPGAVAVPGVHDALSTRILVRGAENESGGGSGSGGGNGVECVFLSGFGVSACRLGMPDAGLLTLSEMEDTARHVCRVASDETLKAAVPVIVDGDTGHGGPQNVRRTVRGLASAGAAAITIEDQAFPKRCTFAAGSALSAVSRSDAMARMQAALAAKHDANVHDGNDVLIVARTDSRNALGFDEALRRCLEFEAMGADIVYAEGLHNRDEYLRLRNSLRHPHTRTMLAQLQLLDPHKQQSLYSLHDVAQMGYDLALFGVTALQATVTALQHVTDIMTNTTTSHTGLWTADDDHRANRQIASFQQLKQAVGFSDLEQYEKDYN